MSDRKTDRKYREYVCGQCKTPQLYLRTEEAPIPCPDCGWHHKDRIKTDLPSEIKIDLSQF